MTLSLEVYSILPPDNELRMSLWNPTLNRLSASQCPFTTGGDHLDVPRVAKFGPQNRFFEGRLKVKNKALWSVFPVETVDPHGRDYGKLCELEVTEDQNLSAALTGSEASTTKNRLAAVAAFERLRIMRNMFSLDLLRETLLDFGFIPPSTADFEPRHASLAAVLNVAVEANKVQRRFDSPPCLPKDYPRGEPTHPAIRKANETVEPLQGLVKRLKRQKEIVWHEYYAKGEYVLAAREFLYMLLELYPWIPTPLIFNSVEAFKTGLAQLHCDLWVKLGQSCLQMARLTGFPEFYVHILDCGEAVVNTRFATYTAQSRAWFLCYEAHAQLHAARPVAFERDHPLLLSHPVAAVNAFLLGHMVRLATPEDKAEAENKPLHKDCREVHVCGARFLGEALQIMDRLTPSAVTVPDGEEPMVLVTDFSVNDP